MAKKALYLFIFSVVVGVPIFAYATGGHPGERCNRMAPCAKGSYCKYNEGACGTSRDGGMCMRIPDICIEIYMPVCGCDGKTYGNSCKASAAGVSVKYKGDCKK